MKHAPPLFRARKHRPDVLATMYTFHSTIAHSFVEQSQSGNPRERGLSRGYFANTELVVDDSVFAEEDAP